MFEFLIILTGQYLNFSNKKAYKLLKNSEKKIQNINCIDNKYSNLIQYLIL